MQNEKCKLQNGRMTGPHSRAPVNLHSAICISHFAFCLLVFAITLLLPAPFFSSTLRAEERREPTKPAALTLDLTAEWGGASRDDVEKVLRSAAAPLLEHAGPRPLAPVMVRRREGAPMVLYDKGPNGQFQVRLNTADRFWCQYAYQFSHEMGHLLTNYDRREPGPHIWFDEALCETASLFALRRMAVVWKTAPPYPNWKDFAPRFDEYVDRLLAERRRRLPSDRTMSQWFAEREDALRRQRELTDDSRLVAAYLLPLFEDEPAGWAAMATYNLGRDDGKLSFHKFLAAWRERAPGAQRPFIGKLEKLFGFE